MGKKKKKRKRERNAKRKKAKKLNPHDIIVRNLEQRLLESNNYYHINIEENLYDNNHQCIGEVDVYALRKVNDETYLLVFEIKGHHCKNNEQKARKQLKRNAEYLCDKLEPDYVAKFYVHGDRNNIKYQYTPHFVEN